MAHKVIDSRFQGTVNNTTSVEMPSAVISGSRPVLSFLSVRCDTNVTLAIYSGTTTSTKLYQVPILSDEGFVLSFPDNTLGIEGTSGSDIVVNLSATGTSCDISYGGYTYRVGV